MRQTYMPDDLGHVQSVADKANQAIIVLKSNVEILTSLRTYYERLLYNEHFPLSLKKACHDDVDEFTSQIGNVINDFGVEITRAQLLVRTVAERKGLVSAAPSPNIS